MPLLNIVIDLYHLNTVDPSNGFHAIKASGIAGIIHKASQGTGSVDPEYDERQQRALSVNLLWGAYHFGTGEDGADQASHFLSIVNPVPGRLLALDFEPNPQGATMSLDQAEAFVDAISAAIGRYPVLYSGQSFLTDQLGSMGAADTVLSNCPLWIARYGPNEPVVPPAFADAGYAVWQYTDGALGLQPHSVPGVGRCDRDKFNGDLNALQAFWGVPPSVNSS